MRPSSAQGVDKLDLSAFHFAKVTLFPIEINGLGPVLVSVLRGQGNKAHAFLCCLPKTCLMP